MAPEAYTEGSEHIAQGPNIAELRSHGLTYL